MRKTVAVRKAAAGRGRTGSTSSLSLGTVHWHHAATLPTADDTADAAPDSASLPSHKADKTASSCSARERRLRGCSIAGEAAAATAAVSVIHRKSSSRNLWKFDQDASIAQRVNASLGRLFTYYAFAKVRKEISAPGGETVTLTVPAENDAITAVLTAAVAAAHASAAAAKVLFKEERSCCPFFYQQQLHPARRR